MNAIPTYVRIRIYRTNYGSIIMYLNGGVVKEILLKLIFFLQKTLSYCLTLKRSRDTYIFEYVGRQRSMDV